jgi:hypothetical protein
LCRLHPPDVVALEVEHLARRQRARFNRNELAGGDPPVEVLPDLGECGLTHRAPERVAHEVAFVHDCLALHLPVARPGHGCMGVLRPIARLALDLPVPRLCHNSLTLISEGGGDLPVALEHFLRTERCLGVASPMSRDLG